MHAYTHFEGEKNTIPTHINYLPTQVTYVLGVPN